MSASRTTPASSGGGTVVTVICSGAAGAWSNAGREVSDEQAVSVSRTAARILRLGVGANLLAQRVVVDAGLQVILQAVGEGDHHVRDPAVLDELGEQRASFAAVVVAQKVPHHVQRQITLEIEDQ